ncbi:MAG: UDP-2,3-diacylglucosamine diphosphatase LpxI [Candidatus Symbiobacter sp.]|nr:UDP-2,3-diacylglucosamine diphosphatase LpxI [Candidatus Symbiobacter sp.]
MKEDKVLGIIAGNGDLPVRLIEFCRKSARPYFVLALEGQTPTAILTDIPHIVVRLGAVGTALAALRGAGVTEIVLAGGVKRPSLLTLKPDSTGMALLARLSLHAFGDDGLLRVLSDWLEEQGFRVIGVDSLLTGLLADLGVLGKFHPDALAQQDIERGIAVARALGQVDVGQAVVVQQGIVLGVEAIEGTDALLHRVANLRRDGLGGVLVKLCKPGQDRRFDLPTIGVETVARAASVGLRGIAVEAGLVIILGRDQVIERANQSGIFIIGIEGGK